MPSTPGRIPFDVAPFALSGTVYGTLLNHRTALAALAGKLDSPPYHLLADVTEFMTLAPGDVLAVGAAAPAPRVRAGQTVAIEIDGLGTLTNRFLAEAA